MRAVIRRLGAFGVWAAALARGTAVVLVPVDWPTTSMPRAVALMNLGPVSSFIVPGQTLVPRERVDSIVLLVGVGGPFGSTTPLRLTVYDTPAKAGLLTDAESVAVSKPDRFDTVWFRFDRVLDAGESVYFELNMPQDTPWPIVVAATREDAERPDGQLYLRGEPGFENQDLVYQLFRHENLAHRLPLFWSEHGASLAAAVGTLVATYVVLLGVAILALRNVASNPMIAGIPAVGLVAIVAGGYVYAFA